MATQIKDRTLIAVIGDEVSEDTWLAGFQVWELASL